MLLFRIDTRSIICMLGGLSLIAMQPVANAQEEIEEIVVSGYLLKSAESASKVDMHIRDIPFTVSNYSEQLLSEVAANDLLDAFRYMTGVDKGGNQTHDITMRGFKSTSNDRNAILTDGLPGPQVRFGSPLAVAIDHIEVVKGPAGVLYGKSQPGGFVNMVMKAPQPDKKWSFGLRSSTYAGAGLDPLDAGGFAVSGDMTGPIDENGDFLYRLVGEINDLGTFRDFVDERNKFLMLGMTWNISDQTTLTVRPEYRYRWANYDLFLPAADRDIDNLEALPITRRYQEPDDYQKETARGVTAFMDHYFGDGTKFRLAARTVRNHDYTLWYDSQTLRDTDGDGSQDALRRRARIGDNHRVNDYADASLTFRPFDLGFLGEHQLLVGATVGVDELDAHRHTFFNDDSLEPGLVIDLANPVYHQVASHAEIVELYGCGSCSRTLVRTRAFGAYLTDFITLNDEWKVTAGIRYDREKLHRESLPSLAAPEGGSSFDGTESDIYPMAGILYQPNDEWSFYGSYSTSFLPPPPNFRDVDGGNTFEPELGTQFEIGAKLFLLDDTLVATLALFDIEKENKLEVVDCNDPNSGFTCHDEVGKEGARGWEFEINARPMPNWNAYFGYSYVDSKILAQEGAINDVPLVGSRSPHTPRDQANLWTRYDIESGPFANLGLAFGIVYAGPRPGNFPTSTDPDSLNSKVLRLPGFTVFDAALYYPLTEKLHASLKVNNIFDKKYYRNVGSTFYERSIAPGDPRTIVLTFNFDGY